MTLDAHLYGDPMLILERKQEAQARKVKQCGGCIYSTSAVFKGEPSCTRKWQTFGHRCVFFQLKDSK